jgi:hypothetical protein
MRSVLNEVGVCKIAHTQSKRGWAVIYCNGPLMTDLSK